MSIAAEAHGVLPLGSRAVGQALEVRRIGPITRADLVRYAGASGDFNPMHFDEDYAKSRGLKDVLAHGLFTAGLLAHTLAQAFDSAQLRRLAVRFAEPVWLGDSLEVSATITGVAGAGSAKRIELDCLVTASGGRRVLTGTATIGDPPPRSDHGLPQT